jgi:hypothetical protein
MNFIMDTNKQYVYIVEDCFGYVTDRHNRVSKLIRLYKDEHYKVKGFYNWYRGGGFSNNEDYWNTEHPIIELKFPEHSNVHPIEIELVPATYEYHHSLYPREIPLSGYSNRILNIEDDDINSKQSSVDINIYLLQTEISYSDELLKLSNDSKKVRRILQDPRY